MKLAGYKNATHTDPDLGWWVEEIEKGKKFRDKHTYRSKWDAWDGYYQNEYQTDLLSSSPIILPGNVFFMMSNSLVPRLYFRDPSVSVIADQPGPMAMGRAIVKERVLNKMIRRMGVKKAMRSMIKGTFFRGAGVGILGYSTQYSRPGSGEEGSRYDGGEYSGSRVEGMPWFANLPLENYVLPSNTLERLDAPWEVYFHWRSVSEVHNDENYIVGNRGTVGPHAEIDKKDIDEASLTALVYEVHDRRTGNFFFFSSDRHLLTTPTIDLDQSSFGGPGYMLVFNDSLRSVYGVPDGQILEPYQREINEILTQIRFHRRLTIKKLIAEKKAIDITEAEAMVNAQLDQLMGVIFVNDINKVTQMNLGGIPPELFTCFDKVMQLVQLTLGFSRNQFGEFRAGSEAATAKEASIVQRATEIRIDERRDMAADLLVGVSYDTLNLLGRQWKEKQVERVIGPYGVPIWVEFTGSDLQDASYDLRIDPDSSLPETKEMKESKAKETFQMLYPLTQPQPDALGGIKAPIISETKLVRLLLHGLHGTQHDDLMEGVPNIYSEEFARSLDEQPGFQKPIAMEQFGQMLQANGPAAGAIQGLQGKGQGEPK